MKKLSLPVTALALVAAPAFGQVELYNNGPMVTHPAQGSGGADVSMASLNPNVAGSNARWFADSPFEYYRVADDFTVPANENWTIQTIVVHAYETNAPPGSPGWSRAELRIFDGAGPEQGTQRGSTSTSTSWQWTNIYRVFNGTGNLLNTARAVNAITFDMGNLQLGPGTYWIDWRGFDGTAVWAPYVMDINPNNPNDPITRPGNARHKINNEGWIAMLRDNAATCELPFIINGTGGGGGYTCTITGVCPGQVNLAWSGAQPNRQQGILFARNTGNFTIQNGQCAGTQLGLGTNQLQLYNTIGTGSGSGNVNAQAGPGACRGFVQLIQVPGCQTSNVAQVP